MHRERFGFDLYASAYAVVGRYVIVLVENVERRAVAFDAAIFREVCFGHAN